MKISTRNVFKGMVSSELTVELPGGIEIVPVITKTSAENLALAEGKEVHVVIKASNVMIA